MDRQQELTNVAANLAQLAASFESVSEFCRKLDINRQQFNKYVAGRHLPAQKVLQKIARFFLMEPDDLTRAPADFRTFFEGHEIGLPFELTSAPELLKMLPLLSSTTDGLRGMHGVYYRYHNSSIYKGKVLRSVLWLYEREGTTRYTTIERFPLLDGSGKTGYTFTYHGFCLLLGDRIFLLDSESKQRNELTMSILNQQHRRPKRFFYGLYTAVASSSYRQPFATRIAFQHVSNGRLERRHLRDATVLAPDDASLPTEIRQYLTGPQALTVWGGED
ncbi:transcriptional regulator [Burkholderia sp. SFA1]|uniref:helix-turn-helix domain-containing protein n=1 Tax=Caballeronia sp. CLC5 TaxID=2906764 RepID=UPI001F35B9A7|nr:helix-turn-helix transcriptional regulator [Caballeronia sp. CLC5]MCE4574882.1 helix-turn-helix transcriptional regulator [Caballeronia sp. CLC5]BBQ00269.1 transcriptional regulator [Burkholderia sp. SFA1]